MDPLQGLQGGEPRPMTPMDIAALFRTGTPEVSLSLGCAVQHWRGQGACFAIMQVLCDHVVCFLRQCAILRSVLSCNMEQNM